MLAIGAMATMMVVVAIGSSLPRMAALAHHRTVPTPAPLHAAGTSVAVVLSIGVGACLWLALESADVGGPVGQRPLLEQLLPVAVAFGLAGCLIMLPWRVQWVADELRRMAWIVPIAALLVVLIDAALGEGLALAWLVVWVATGAALYWLGRILQRAAQRTR